MAQETPFYETVVEPVYAGLPEYNEVETEGINRQLVMNLITYVVVAVATVIIVVYAYIGQLHKWEAERIGADAPYTVQVEEGLRVQHKLDEYNTVDATAGKYQVPVADVMKQMVADARTQTVETVAAKPVATPAKTN